MYIGQHAFRILFVFIAIFSCGPAFSAGNDSRDHFSWSAKKPHIVFLVTEDSNNYEAHKTIPVFAKLLEKQHGYQTTVLLGSGTHGAYTYPDFEVLSKADLLVVFARRIALPGSQMQAIKNYLAMGKPLVGIRTANHAFAVNDSISSGFEQWRGFVADFLGCENHGYGDQALGYDVSLTAAGANHAITKDITPKQWHSEGSIYLVQPLLDEKAVVLLQGKVNDKTEPVAWIRSAGKTKVFYTSLGFPSDFSTPHFVELLTNGIQWALKKN